MDMPMIRSQRLREQELLDREARGEEVWTSELSDRFRRRAGYMTRRLIPDHFGNRYFERGIEDILREGRGEDVPRFHEILRSGPTDMVLDALETLGRAIPELIGDINGLFRQERLLYEIIRGELVDIESRELHTEVVKPAILLLGRADLRQIDDAYRDALKKLDPEPAGAITDVARAVEAMLRHLGCDGNALGPLITAARKRGLIAGHDQRLLNWISADRSERGDAHDGGPDATRDDAWLAVHVAGAVILRLSQHLPPQQ